MNVYKDVITGDPLVSDGWKITVVGDVAFEVDCQEVPVRTGGDGGGPRPRGEDEDDEPGMEDDHGPTVIDLVQQFRPTEVHIDRKGYLSWIRGYMKQVESTLRQRGTSPADIATFRAGSQRFLKEVILPNFTGYNFYTGPSGGPDAMLFLLNYRDDGVTPYFTFWKDGLQKVQT